MSQIDTLKAQAKNLKQAMTKMGLEISLAQALEAIAQQYGFNNWDTLAGIVNNTATRAPAPSNLSYLTSIPHRVDLHIFHPIERYSPGLVVSCVVDYFDLEALALLHDEAHLERHLLSNPEKYANGMETAVIRLTNSLDSQSHFVYTLKGLKGITYKDGKWFLRNNVGTLQFHCHGDSPVPAAAPALTIPQMVKSAKGCRLLILTSQDGAQYDRHVIVPAHLNAPEISKKIAEEIRRLKDIETVLEATGDTENAYTEADLARYINSLGCLWVDEPIIVSETWD